MPVTSPTKKIKVARKASREWLSPKGFLPSAIRVIPIIIKVVPIPFEKNSDARSTPTIRSQSPVSVCWIPDLESKLFVLGSSDTIGAFSEAIRLG